MPVLQVTMNRMLSANSVLNEPSMKTSVCLDENLHYKRQWNWALFYHGLFSQCSQCCITGVMLKSEGLGRWERGKEKRKWSDPISYKLQTFIVPPVGWGSYNLNCVFSFCSSYAWHGICQWVSVNWLTEWMGEQITILNLPLLLLIITWASSDHWHMSRRETNCSVMLEDLNLKDLRYAILTINPVPITRFRISAGGLGHGFNLCVPQLPKLHHGDKYSTCLIGWGINKSLSEV